MVYRLWGGNLATFFAIAAGTLATAAAGVGAVLTAPVSVPVALGAMIAAGIIGATIGIGVNGGFAGMYNQSASNTGQANAVLYVAQTKVASGSNGKGPCDDFGAGSTRTPTERPLKYGQGSPFGSSPPRPNDPFTGRPISNSEFGNSLVSWGQFTAGALGRLLGLSVEVISNMSLQGVNQSMAQEWANFYWSEASRNPQNPSACSRAHLMQAIADVLKELKR
jgi:hypothetical protein